MAEAKDPLLSILQSNGKGWNAELLVNPSEISKYSCKECNNISREAVELGCDHTDNEIDLYCNVCLQQVIKSNNNQCPINSSHNNPSIIPTRRIRKHIYSLNVYCPNSTYYQKICNNNNNNNDNMVFDTIDEKEGGNINKPNNKQNVCDWSGTLDKLINDHIKKCKAMSTDIINKNIQNLNIKINELSENIIITNKQNKQNKNEINTIKNEVISIKNMSLEQDKKLDEIRNNNNNTMNEKIVGLQNELKEKDNKIISIENKMKKMQEMISKLMNEMSELNKNNEDIKQNDDIHTVKYDPKFDQQHKGNNVQIISPKKIQVSSANYQTARFEQALPSYKQSPKITEWKIQYLDGKGGTGTLGHPYFFFGVVSEHFTTFNDPAYQKPAQLCGIGNPFVYDGVKGSRERDEQLKSHQINYKDVIQIQYDSYESKLVFFKNNQQIYQLKLPTDKVWYPAASWEIAKYCQIVQ